MMRRRPFEDFNLGVSKYPHAFLVPIVLAPHGRSARLGFAIGIWLTSKVLMHSSARWY